jgi:Arc/MetJ-type ribon-helix-helix transcriptional regulator
VALSASDVIRPAVSRLRDQLLEKELRKGLIAHVRSEAERSPGRARRGLPEG